MLGALASRLWRTLFTELRDCVDAEMLRYRADTPANQVTKRIAIICIGAATAMLVVRFRGREADTEGSQRPAPARPRGALRWARWR